MNKDKSFGAIAIVVFLVLSLSLYTVQEGQQGILLRLGKIIEVSEGKADVKEPGLHFKVPLLNQVRQFDIRLQTLDVQSSRIPTEEQKYVIVDYYAKWRIDDTALFFKRTGGNQRRAETLLMQQINDGLRAEFGKRGIREVISGERSNVMHILRDGANKGAKDLGIYVLDVRIKRIDLPTEVSASVYNRMRTAREKVATERRAEGRKEAAGLRAAADKFVVITLAKAYADAARIRGEGDAQAAKIYANAFGRDPRFYAFYRSLSAYEKVFRGPQDLLVLRPDSQFFEYFGKINGRHNNS